VNPPNDPPTPERSLAPPTVEARAWAQGALTAVRSARAALTRLTVDHRRELTPFQAAELAAVRNHVDAAQGALALLAFQLDRAVTPEPDPADWAAAMVVPPTAEELEAAEAAADQAYDVWKNGT
jgi:hypothetical protein